MSDSNTLALASISNHKCIMKCALWYFCVSCLNILYRHGRRCLWILRIPSSYRRLKTWGLPVSSRAQRREMKPLEGPRRGNGCPQSSMPWCPMRKRLSIAPGAQNNRTTQFHLKRTPLNSWPDESLSPKYHFPTLYQTCVGLPLQHLRSLKKSGSHVCANSCKHSAAWPQQRS